MSLKACSSCHEEKSFLEFSKNKNTKDGLSYTCKSCVKKYKQDNKGRANLLVRKKRKKNPIKYRQQSNKSHQNNRNERLVKQHIYYENNKEYFAKKNKNYRNENIDQILLRNRQREKLLDSFPVIQQSEINKLLEKCDNKCFYCKIDVKRGINLHLDHKTPLFRGGAHSIDNLVSSCQKCNLKKGTKTVEEFLNGNK